MTVTSREPLYPLSLDRGRTVVVVDSVVVVIVVVVVVIVVAVVAILVAVLRYSSQYN